MATEEGVWEDQWEEWPEDEGAAGPRLPAASFSGVAAATCENVAAARRSRAINDSNVLCLGGKVTAPEAAREICDAWLSQEHGRAPEDPPPEWWSDDVENFFSDCKKLHLAIPDALKKALEDL